MTDGYMKDCCKTVEHAVNRLEQLEKALDGLDLFLDVWGGRFDVVAPNGWDKLLWNVQERSHIYLDGFRAALRSAEKPCESDAAGPPLTGWGKIRE